MKDKIIQIVTDIHGQIYGLSQTGKMYWFSDDEKVWKLEIDSPEREAKKK